MAQMHLLSFLIHGPMNHTILSWADQSRVDWHYIAPGKPMQNAFIESFMYRRPRGCAMNC